MAQSAGSTVAVAFGSSGEMLMMPMAVLVNSTIFGVISHSLVFETFLYKGLRT